MSITGYGWVFPLGDGTLNIGIGVVSTAKEFRALNTTHLLEHFADDIAERWRIDPRVPAGAPASGRAPMGGSVGPTVGPTWLVIGDAAGSANPFVGAGIEYAYETGRIAGSVLDEALREQNERPRRSVTRPSSPRTTARTSRSGDSSTASRVGRR